jgi:hypothetical protein
VSAKTARGARTRALAAAAGLYFSLVFGVGLVLGPVRVLWIEPRLGAALAVVLEAPFLLIAMVVAAVLAPRWAGVAGDWRSYLAIGVTALLLQQIADLAVGWTAWDDLDRPVLLLRHAGWMGLRSCVDLLRLYAAHGPSAIATRGRWRRTSLRPRRIEGLCARRRRSMQTPGDPLTRCVAHGRNAQRIRSRDLAPRVGL